MISLTENSDRRQFWLLALICFFSLFLFLGETFFHTRGEPREAVVALSMLNDGNWILPVNNGVDMAYKPPFFHWLVALASLVTGGVSEYTARFPSALALTVMCLCTYVFYARRRDAETALLTSLLLLTSFEVHRAGVACRVDMVLTAMMVVSLFQLYKWVERGFRGFPLWGVLCLSGAFLTKGPVGAALPCLTVWIYAGVRGRGWWLNLLRFVGIGLCSCLLPLAWYWAAYLQGGQRFLDLVYEENVLRLTGRMTYESHVNPWWYNVVTLIAGFVPYTLLLLISLIALRFKRPRAAAGNVLTRLRSKVRAMDDARLFTLISAVVIFVFYCIPKSKRSVYLLPVYPFLAYYLAEYVVYLRNHHRRTVQTFTAIVALLAVVLTALFAAIRCGLVPDTLFHGHSAETNRAMLSALRDTPLSVVSWAVVAVPALGAVFAVCSGLRIRGMMVAVLSLYFALDGVYQPLVLNVKSDRPQARLIEAVEPEGRIYSFRTDVTEGNPMHPFTLNFYLGDRVVPFEAFIPQTGCLIVGNDEIEAFRARYPEYAVQLVCDFDHRSCDDHKMLRLYRFRRLLR